MQYQDRPVLARGRAVVGIDIGKQKHSAFAIGPQGEKRASLASFDNDRAGVDRLEAVVLRAAGPPTEILFAMEATGHYWMPLYHELLRRGYEGVALNPIQTHGEARARIRKTKTDHKDAEGIARFILTGKAHATRIPDEDTEELRIMTRRLHQMTQMKGDVERAAHSLIDRAFPEYSGCFSKPFLPSARKLILEVGLTPDRIAREPEEVRALLRRAGRGRLTDTTINNLITRAQTSIGIARAATVINEELATTVEVINDLETQIALLDERLRGIMEERESPLMSLGIGPALAAAIHAESDPASDFPSARKYAAYAGLEPDTFQSGAMKGTRAHISKRGSPHLRNALYQTAFVIYRRHDCFHRLYKRFRKEGRRHKDALVIVARHVAMVIWRMLVDNRPFSKRPPQRAK